MHFREFCVFLHFTKLLPCFACCLRTGCDEKTFLLCLLRVIFDIERKNNHQCWENLTTARLFFDHSLSHFHARSTRIQWRNCGQRAPRGSIFCSRKHIKELKNAIYCAFGTFWEHQAAGLSPVTPAKKAQETIIFWTSDYWQTRLF